MENGIIFDIDPVMLQLGPIQLRYYGTIFTLMFWIGFFQWRHYMLRGGYTQEMAVRLLPWFLGGLILGARLGHCLFYQPDIYLADPKQILFFWKGGLSSHGATVGLLAALLLYARFNRLPYIDIVDRFTPATATAAAAVRLGNFFNSEIVGRETDLPWAIRFVRYEDGGAVARHPTQLYEFLLGLFVLAVLTFVDHKAGKEKRPVGLIMGTFGAVYFGIRFFVEFTKEYQTSLDDSLALTVGQYLSIPACGIGVWLVVRALRHGRPPVPPTPPSPSGKRD
jgi:prolipoprotein diacylglyceryl transferase